MRVQLIEYTQNPEAVVAAAAAQCYNPGFAGDYYQPDINEAGVKRIKFCIEHGHTSVLEHASFTFAVEGISRACSHQLVRHRLASYSQQSQRYITNNDLFAFVTPASIRDSKFLPMYADFMVDVHELYAKMVEAGVPAEDARYILPNACEANIVVTMNARELRNFFSLRCCSHAQWEIRMLAGSMLDLVKCAAPSLFEGAGAQCSNCKFPCKRA